MALLDLAQWLLIAIVSLVFASISASVVGRAIWRAYFDEKLRYLKCSLQLSEGKES